VSLGGRDIRPGINVYRFANRIPLLFEVTPTTLKTAASRLSSPCAINSMSGSSLRRSRAWHADTFVDWYCP